MRKPWLVCVVLLTLLLGCSSPRAAIPAETRERAVRSKQTQLAPPSPQQNPEAALGASSPPAQPGDPGTAVPDLLPDQLVANNDQGGKPSGGRKPSPGTQLLPGPNDQEEYALRPRVPILMYHEIGSPSGPWRDLYVEPQVFARQLDWLQENGYATVSLQEVYEHWRERKPLPEKPVVLTFDDGYPSVYEVVWPLLRQRGMRATLFLYPAKLNTGKGLSSKMVAELAGAGMEIGSHTFNHLDLTQLEDHELERELAKAKKVLEEISKKPVNFLSYPAGSFNQEVVAAAKKYGYLGAVTTNYGFATPEQSPYQWKRVRINYSDGVKGLARKLGNNQ